MKIKKSVAKAAVKAETKKTVKAVKAAPAAKAPAKKAPAAKKAVTFTLRAESGKKVFLAGSFNGWDPAAKPMAEKKGVYSTSLRLEPGKYEYKFVVDGTWCADPECLDCVPNDQGTLNSVVTVK